MVQIKVNYLRNSIFKYIDSLDKRTRNACFKTIIDLETFGNELTIPISKSIGDGLFELRIKESLNIRIIYTFHNKEAWILHAFKKTSSKISSNDIDIALQRKKLLLA